MMGKWVVMAIYSDIDEEASSKHGMDMKLFRFTLLFVEVPTKFSDAVPQYNVSNTRAESAKSDVQCFI